MKKALMPFASISTLLLLIMWIGHFGHRQRVLDQLTSIKAVDVTVRDSAQYHAWWDSTAACLGVSKKYNVDARWFVTDTIPAEMLALGDGHRSYFGYTDPSAQIVVLAQGQELDRAIVTHEAWHLAFGIGHPDATFNPPRCGLSPP